MAKARLVNNNFTRGQLSKRMRGRDDLDFYRAATELQVNFDSDVQGSGSYRKGTVFLGETKDNNPAVFYEFVFSETESYALEFTDQVLRFWTADGLVALELVTPYVEADLFDLQIAQTADTMYIAHKDYAPRVLVRTAVDTFTLNLHVLTGSIPAGMNWTGDSTTYPATVAIYERRLMYAGSDRDPQTIFMSQSFLYDDFGQGTGLDDEGIEYRIGSDRINRIVWMSPLSNQCVVGTIGGTFDMSSGSTQEPITPSTVQITPSSTKGVLGIRPARRDNTVIYVESGGRVLNSYQYQFEADSHVAVDRTVLSEDITESGITSVRFASGDPDRVLCTLNNGDVAQLVWKPDQQVFAWSTIQTDGDLISYAALPNTEGSDRVIQCVKRVINGVTKHYVEVSAEDYTLPDRQTFFTGDEDADEKEFRLETYEAQKQYIHIDSALTTDGSTRGLSAGANLTIPTAAIGASVTVTSSSSVFLSTDVGNQIRVKEGEGWGEVTAFTSGTEVTMRVITEFDETSYSAGDYYITFDTITGLSHLEGKTVSICNDGAENEMRVVSSGAITLSDDQKTQGSVVHVGLPYTGVLKTLDLQGGVQFPTEGRYKVTRMANILFLQTAGASFGSNVYKLETLPFQTTDNNTDRPPLPFSGYKEVTFRDATARSKNVIVLQNKPLPCTIQQIVTELTVN